MDELDRKILRLLSADGRMTVKDIARQVSLTSPAVSERIRRMEKTGVIAGYTVVLGDAEKPYRRADQYFRRSGRQAVFHHDGGESARRGAMLSCYGQPQLYCEGELRGHP